MKAVSFARIAVCSLILMGSMPALAAAQGMYAASAFAGMGRKDSPTGPRDVQLGVSLSASALNSFAGFELEGGYVGPSSFSNGGSGLFSASYRPVFMLGRSVFPFATIGYSRLNIGNALNVGGGVDYFPNSSRRFGLRVEVRDYVVVRIPTQFPAVRGGFVFAAFSN